MDRHQQTSRHPKSSLTSETSHWPSSSLDSVPLQSTYRLQTLISKRNAKLTFIWREDFSDQLYPYNPTRIWGLVIKDFSLSPDHGLKHRGDRAFAVAGPRLWNSLPAYISSAQSLTVFKWSLKTYLFSLAFNSLWVYGMNLWVVLCSMSLFVQHFGQPCLLFLNVLYK